MRRNKITFRLGIVVILLLGGCSAPQRVGVQDTIPELSNGIPSTNNLRITLLLAPKEKVHLEVVGIGARKTIVEHRMTILQEYPPAAQAVFAFIGSVSGEVTIYPHLVASINEASCKVVFSSSCLASVDLYWGTGKFIRTYEAKGHLDHPLTTATFYNSFVEVFKSIAEQMLADELLAQYFDNGFDDSLSSATPNIPQLPRLHVMVDEVRREEQVKKNRHDSEIILTNVRSRGYALASETETVLSLGPIPSVLDSFVLEALLPFPQEMDQALIEGNLRKVKSTSYRWRSWLERSQRYLSPEAEESVQYQLAHLDRLDNRLNDPVAGKLSVKLAKAIEEERWEDAKNIAALIESTAPPEAPKPVVADTVQVLQNLSSGEECSRAQRDLNQAQARYNSAQSSRGSSRLIQAVGILGMFSPIPNDQIAASVFSGAGRNSATDSQADMNHSLAVMQDAKSRIAIYCY